MKPTAVAVAGSSASIRAKVARLSRPCGGAVRCLTLTDRAVRLDVGAVPLQDLTASTSAVGVACVIPVTGRWRYPASKVLA